MTQINISMEQVVCFVAVVCFLFIVVGGGGGGFMCLLLFVCWFFFYSEFQPQLDFFFLREREKPGN